jgi:hypothetical protein
MAILTMAFSVSGWHFAMCEIFRISGILRTTERLLRLQIKCQWLAFCDV